MDKTIIATGACAVLMGAPMKIVINAKGKQEAVKEILKVLGQI